MSNRHLIIHLILNDDDKMHKVKTKRMTCQAKISEYEKKRLRNIKKNQELVNKYALLLIITFSS